MKTGGKRPQPQKKCGLLHGSEALREARAQATHDVLQGFERLVRTRGFWVWLACENLTDTNLSNACNV